MIAEIPTHVVWALWITAGGTLADMVIRLVGHRGKATLNYAQAHEASSQAALNQQQAELLGRQVSSGIAAELHEKTRDLQ